MGESELYDTSAVIELIARRGYSLVPGAVSILTLVEYPPAAPRVIRVIYPSKDDYALAMRWQIELRRLGKPLPAIDLVIAATAYNRGMTLVTLDKHFNTIRLVEPSLRLRTSI